MGDDLYMDFLNKSSEAEFQEENNRVLEELKNLDENAEVPEVLRTVTQGVYYVSDADEPFMPVVLRTEGGFPDEVSFAKLVNFSEPTSAEVRIMETCTWDPHGVYTNIIDAVKTAVENSEIKVYQICISNTRSEYWIFGIKDNVLLGVKAIAIES